MGKKRTTTVTHPDGTVSTRKSETRTYTHAVAVGPAPAEAMASYLDRQAADRTADAAKLREAAASARVTIRDRRLGGNTRDLITHVAMLAGTEVHTWCSADGRTESHRDAETQVVEVGQYLRESARSSAEWREQEAAQRVAEAAAIRAAGVPVGGWSVVRWSSRADLAEAALSTFAHLAAQGRPVVVVPVDASDTPPPATPAREEEAPTRPSDHAMRSAYTAESGRPWADDDPRCQAFVEMWRAAWDSASTHAPEEATSLAVVVEDKYRVDAPASTETPTPTATPFVSGWTTLADD
jgi:hypothetical protein